MKKILAMLLALAMVFALVACGQDAPAADDGAQGDDAASGYEAVELMFATTYNEMETSGQAITYFTCRPVLST